MRQGALENRAAKAGRGKRTTLSESIAACLLSNLEDGRLEPGSVLLNSDLARYFNVSRIPVGEALKTLADEGRLIKRASQGYVVPGDFSEETRLDTQRLEIPKSFEDELDRQPKWERVFDRIEQELVQIMPYGSFRITESGMADYYGVNRGDIQQVLTRLCDRGIAEKPSQSHCHLLAYDEDFISQRYDLRAILEPEALLRAAPNILPEEVRSVLDAHLRVRESFSRLAKTWLPKLELQLHRDLVGRCPNERILDAIAGAQMPIISTTRMIRRVLGHEVEEPLLAEHIAVLEALLTGDEKQAARMLKRHLDRSAKRSIARLALFAKTPMPAVPPFLRPR